MPSDPLINQPSTYIPPTEEQLRDKRKRTTIAILGVFIALIGMTLLENYFLQAQSASTFGEQYYRPCPIQYYFDPVIFY